MLWARWGAGAIAATLVAGCAATSESVAAADEGPVTCREALVPGSNVVDEVCLTEKGWERYEQRQRAKAQDVVRRIQGMSAGF